MRSSRRSRKTDRAVSAAVVLDTMVVTALINENRDPERAARYVELINGRPRLISFVTVSELRYGAFKAGWGEFRSLSLERDLGEYSIAEAEDPLLTTCAEIRWTAFRRGHPLSQKIHDSDRWIAALRDLDLTAKEGSEWFVRIVRRRWTGSSPAGSSAMACIARRSTPISEFHPTSPPIRWSSTTSWPSDASSPAGIVSNGKYLAMAADGQSQPRHVPTQRGGSDGGAEGVRRSVGSHARRPGGRQSGLHRCNAQASSIRTINRAT